MEGTGSEKGELMPLVLANGRSAAIALMKQCGWREKQLARSEEDEFLWGEWWKLMEAGGPAVKGLRGGVQDFAVPLDYRQHKLRRNLSHNSCSES